MNIRGILIVTALLTASGVTNAATMRGAWLNDNMWSLIHAGSTPQASMPSSEHLRWDAGQHIMLERSGNMLMAGGSQTWALTSRSGHQGSFTLHDMELNLDGPQGFHSGWLDYTLTVVSGPLANTYSGTFMFEAMAAAGVPFNSSGRASGNFELYLWGGDALNNIGIDIGVVVPLPAPLLLLGSSLLGLGFLRRTA